MAMSVITFSNITSIYYCQHVLLLITRGHPTMEEIQNLLSLPPPPILTPNTHTVLAFTHFQTPKSVMQRKIYISQQNKEMK